MIALDVRHAWFEGKVLCFRTADGNEYRLVEPGGAVIGITMLTKRPAHVNRLGRADLQERET